MSKNMNEDNNSITPDTDDTDNSESITTLENYLYNAIITWYDDSLTEYHGLDDEEFVKRVCDTTGMAETDYEDLMADRREDCSWNN